MWLYCVGIVMVITRQTLKMDVAVLCGNCDGYNKADIDSLTKNIRLHFLIKQIPQSGD